MRLILLRHLLLFSLVIIVCQCSSGVQEETQNKETAKKAHIEKPYRELYPNGKVKIEGVLKGDKREGTWTAWYETGVKWSESHFSEGKQNGNVTVWYPSGKIRYQGTYENGKPTGTWLYYDEKGEVAQKVSH